MAVTIKCIITFMITTIIYLVGFLRLKIYYDEYVEREKRSWKLEKEIDCNTCESSAAHKYKMGYNEGYQRGKADANKAHQTAKRKQFKRKNRK